ncbi:MAG: ISNCY family transposase [Nitrospirota bacterium]
MRGRELKRLHVIYKLNEKKLNQQEASELLGLCVRQVRRISKRVLKEGDTGIIHKSRGKPSNRLFSEDLKNRAISLYRGKYSDFGPTLANEKMEEIEGIKVSTQTLRNWLIGEGLWKQKRRQRKHRQWRERKGHFGEMLQMDGSHHDWLEGRGDELVLMAYIDDATNRVFARFYEYEGTIPAMDSFKQYVKEYGAPMSLYLDRHTTYKSTAKPTLEDELNNRGPMSQFERSMEEIGVKVKHALSPQAKGRVERLFGTFQDRLIKEMRLKGIKTKGEANKFLEYYLPLYNERFSFKAAREGDLHRGIPARLDIDKVLCIKTRRSVRNDFTIAHNKKLYQITEHINGKEVIVEERTDGSMLITYNGRSLKFKEIDSRPVKDKVTGLRAIESKTKKVHIPPKDHPWRKYPVVNRYRHKEIRESLLTET